MAASNRPIGSEPENTAAGLNADTSNPVFTSTEMSNTTRMLVSSTSETPSTFELKSTPRRAITKDTMIDNRPQAYQCRLNPVRSEMTNCMKKPLVPMVPTTKKL